MAENKDFLRQDGDYRTMKAFRKAECIYDVTYYFAHTFLQTGDRTHYRPDGAGGALGEAEPGPANPADPLTPVDLAILSSPRILEAPRIPATPYKTHPAHQTH